MSLSASHQSFSSTPKIAVIELPPVAKLWLLGAYNRIFWVSPRVANWPQPIANATQARTYKMQLLHFKSEMPISQQLDYKIPPAFHLLYLTKNSVALA